MRGICFTPALFGTSTPEIYALLRAPSSYNNSFSFATNDILTDSTQEICNLLSGVIQGSNIGPLLFICFINELAEILGPMFVTAKFLPMI